MKKIMRSLSVGILVFVLLPINSYGAKPEWAGKKENKADYKSSHVHEDKTGLNADSLVSEAETILEGLFSTAERKTILDYYRYAESDAHPYTGKQWGKKKELPKGLRKKLERGGELPPGWQKKVARGEVLDVELRYQSTYLPESLLSRLSRERTATEIIKLKDKIIRVSKGEGTIVDIVDLADLLIRTTE
jgi:hypothetical protein